MSTYAIPQDFGYVLAVGLGYSSILPLWQGALVGKHRKAAGIEYPQAYAEKAEVAANPAAKKFNCAQRAHHNTIENLPSVVVTLLLSGLKYPRAAAGLGAVALLGRVVYTLGYVSGEPKARLRGVFEYLGRLPLLGLAIYTVYQICTTGI